MRWRFIKLDNFNWKRIILDEGHEYLNYKFRNKKHNSAVFTELYKLKSDYKWVCSGTPYFDNKSSWDIINFICDLNGIDAQDMQGLDSWQHDVLRNILLTQLYHDHKMVIDKLFIKNTKES